MQDPAHPKVDTPILWSRDSDESNSSQEEGRGGEGRGGEGGCSITYFTSNSEDAETTVGREQCVKGHNPSLSRSVIQ